MNVNCGWHGSAFLLLLGWPRAAPLLISLIRYNDLYFFVHYSGYANLRDWLNSSLRAVSGPVFVVAVIGLLITLLIPRTLVEQMVAWTAVIYCALTAYLVLIDWPARWTEQLETTRLMPFQRLLMISLAAIAIGRVSRMVVARLSPLAVRVRQLDSDPVCGRAARSSFRESDRGLVREGTMAQPGIVDLRAAVEMADLTAATRLGGLDPRHDRLLA